MHERLTIVNLYKRFTLFFRVTVLYSRIANANE